MPVYRIVLRGDSTAEPQTFELAANDLAYVFGVIERFGEFVEAEIWHGDSLLCSAEVSSGQGPIWRVTSRDAGKRGRKNDAPE